MTMRVTVATIALERQGSGELMLEALAALSDQGYHACVGDGGSSPEFVAKVQGMGHEVWQPGRGIRGQIETALEQAAARGTHVCYLESDKLEYVQSGLARTIEEYRDRELDYAVVGRPAEQWNTFPLAQVEIEKAESALMAAVLGFPGDFVAGPTVTPSDHVAKLAESPFYGTAQHGWGTNWFLLGRAWLNGLQLGVINTAPGVHPSAKDEFNPGYRFYQANAIVGCFYQGAGIAYDWRTDTGARVSSVPVGSVVAP